MRATRIAAFAVTAASFCAAARAQTPPTQPDPITFQDTVQVTATRFGEPVAQVPGSIAVVTGDELRARGAVDLRTALAWVGGVSVAPGGDAGPAGGAFRPQMEAISLTNVERIEVMRGATPVYFGTTAFAGTINVIHYTAGNTDSTGTFHIGSYQSGGIGGAAVLSSGRVRQSIGGELMRENFSDPRASYRRAQGTWRLATQLGRGAFRADVDLLALRQKPDSPAPIDDATGAFSQLLPVDFNQNPLNAALDTNRFKVVADYDVPMSFGRWGSTIAYTHTNTDSIRGFIDAGDTPQPWTTRTSADLESFKQSLGLHELFVDSHVTLSPAKKVDLTAGVNVLAGDAAAASLRYGQRLLLDGVSQVPGTESMNAKGTVDFTDRRRFVGVYTQSRYEVTSRTSLLAGLRWNSTRETRDEVRVNSRGVRTTIPASQDVDRLTGSIGAAWRVWQPGNSPLDAVTVHGSVGYTFQPAQIDFGPNPEAQPEGGGLLAPETQRSVIAGLKADAAHGRMEFDVDGFFVDFYNQPTHSTAGGAPVLRSIGQQRYKGVDMEGVVRAVRAVTLKGNVGWTDALYSDFLTDVDGVATQLAGRHQVLNPSVRAGAGVLIAPARGWRASLTATWIGAHWLNSLNTFEAPAYAVVDASLGYRFARFTAAALASNLGNRRDAVQMSELGEGQFYRLPARRIGFTLTWHYTAQQARHAAASARRIDRAPSNPS